MQYPDKGKHGINRYMQRRRGRRPKKLFAFVKQKVQLVDLVIKINISLQLKLTSLTNSPLQCDAVQHSTPTTPFYITVMGTRGGHVEKRLHVVSRGN